MFFNVLALVVHFAIEKQIDGTALARVQPIVGVQFVAHLVTIDHGILASLQDLHRQLPGRVDIVCQTQPVTSQVDGRRAAVIQFYPRVGEVVQIVHDTIDVRLHQFVDAQLAFLLAIVLHRCLDQIDARDDNCCRLAGLKGHLRDMLPFVLRQFDKGFCRTRLHVMMIIVHAFGIEHQGLYGTR